MRSLCLAFLVHQPIRLRQDYDFFSIGRDHSYEDTKINREAIRRLADSRLLPASSLLLKLIRRHKGKLRLALSISGLCLEELESYAPEALYSFRRLVATGCVELLGGSHHNSVAFLFSKEEFSAQLKLHRESLKRIFDARPGCFCNTELIYGNDLCPAISGMGYDTVLTEGSPMLLGRKSATRLYRSSGRGDACVAPAAQAACDMGGLAASGGICLLLSSRELSMEFGSCLAAKEGNPAPEAEAFAHSLQRSGKNALITLCADYGNIGKRGLVFLEDFIEGMLASPDFRFETPSEASHSTRAAAELDVPGYVSRLGSGRDLGDLLGNPMQEAAAQFAYGLEKAVKESGKAGSLKSWRRLLSIDHLLCMRTGQSGDQPGPGAGSPFRTAHEAFVCYCNALNDLKLSLNKTTAIGAGH